MKSKHRKKLLSAVLLVLIVLGSLANPVNNHFSKKAEEIMPLVNFEDPISDAVRWSQRNFEPFFDLIASVIRNINEFYYHTMNFFPLYEFKLSSEIGVGVSMLAIALALLVGLLSGYKYAAATFVVFEIFLCLGYWKAALVTFSLVLTAAFISIAIGFPLGVIMARSDRCETLISPALDFMQSFPPYIYLVPAVVFFGLGAAPGVVATVLFAVPPPARLTNLGIREIPYELKEAGRSFGCNSFQLLYKVEFPEAFPSILVGINQCIMMSLGMVVIAALIGAGGLGAEVIVGIQRLWIGKGIVAGLLVVMLAMINKLTN